MAWVRCADGGYFYDATLTIRDINDVSPKMIRQSMDKKVANSATLLERAKAIRKTLV